VLGFSRIRRTQSAPEVAQWSRACRRLARAGLAWRPDERPLDYAERAAARWPRWGVLLRGIGGSYAQLRYGPRREHHTALPEQLAHLLDRFAQQVRDIVERGIAVFAGQAVRLQVTECAQHDVEFLHDVGRQADGPRLVHDRALDRLPYPPGCVRGEAKPALGI